MTVRLPQEGNRRIAFSREEIRPLAAAMFDARSKGTRLRNDLSLTGNSTIAQLVGAFGYPNQRIRTDSLNQVLSQLKRAGLEVTSETDRWGRDDKFWLQVKDVPADADDEAEEIPELTLQTIKLPDVFWPAALGLDSNLEILFLRSLTAQQPILCMLHMPDNSEIQTWLQATWEGMTS